MHVPLDDRRRSRIPARPFLRAQMIEDAVQNRPSARHTGDLVHRRAIEVADPNADRELRRKADRPIVAKVRARARFARYRIVVAQCRMDAERERARGVIAQHVRDLPDQFRSRIASRERRRISHHAPRPELAEPRETRVGIRDLEQPPFAIPERQAEAIHLGWLVECR